MSRYILLLISSAVTILSVFCQDGNDPRTAVSDKPMPSDIGSSLTNGSCLNYYDRVCKRWANRNYETIKNYQKYRTNRGYIRDITLWEKGIADELIKFLSENLTGSENARELSLKRDYHKCTTKVDSADARISSSAFNVTHLIDLLNAYDIAYGTELRLGFDRSTTTITMRSALNRVMRNLSQNFSFGVFMTVGVSKAQLISNITNRSTTQLLPHVYPQLILFSVNRVKRTQAYKKFIGDTLVRLVKLAKESAPGIVDQPFGDANFFLNASTGDINQTIGDIVDRVMAVDTELKKKYNVSTESETVEFSELQSRFSSMDWVEYFDAAFASRNVSFESHHTIELYQPQEMEVWNDLINTKLGSNEGILDMRYYILWSLLEHLLIYFPQQFDDIRYQYYTRLHNTTVIPPTVSRAYSCLDGLANDRESPLLSIYYNRHNDIQKNREVLQIIEKIKVKVVKVITNWTETDIRGILINLVEGLHFVVDHNETFTEGMDHVTVSDNSTETGEGDDNFTILMKKLKRERQVYLSRGVDYYTWYWNSILATDITYTSKEHWINIPTGLIASLDDDSSAARYGQLVALVSKAISKAIIYNADDDIIRKLTRSQHYVHFLGNVSEGYWIGRYTEYQKVTRLRFENVILDSFVTTLTTQVIGSGDMVKKDDNQLETSRRDALESFTQSFCGISSRRLDEYLVGNYTNLYKHIIDIPLLLMINQDPNYACPQHLDADTIPSKEI